MSICCVAVVGSGSHCRRIVELFGSAGVSVRVIPWHPHDDGVGPWGAEHREHVRVYRQLEAAWECDLVVVSVPGGPVRQRQALRAVEPRISGGAALAIDTSAARLEAYTAVLERPEQAVGIRFPRPIAAWDLVEVTPGPETAPGVQQSVLLACQALGKHAYEPIPQAEAAE